MIHAVQNENITITTLNFDILTSDRIRFYSPWNLPALRNHPRHSHIWKTETGMPLAPAEQRIYGDLQISDAQEHLVNVANQVQNRGESGTVYYSPRIAQVMTGVPIFGVLAKRRLKKYRARLANPEEPPIIHHITCIEFVILIFQLAFYDERHTASPLFLHLDAKVTPPYRLAIYLESKGWIKYKVRGALEARSNIAETLLSYQQHFQLSCGAASLIHICGELGLKCVVNNLSKTTATRQWRRNPESGRELDFFNLLQMHNIEDETACRMLSRLEYSLMFSLSLDEHNKYPPANRAPLLPLPHNNIADLRDPLYSVWGGGAWPTAMIRTAEALGLKLVGLYVFADFNSHPIFSKQADRISDFVTRSDIKFRYAPSLMVNSQLSLPPLGTRCRGLVLFGTDHWLVRRPNLDGQGGNGGWWMDPFTGANIPSDPHTNLPMRLPPGVPNSPSIQLSFTLRSLV